MTQKALVTSMVVACILTGSGSAFAEEGGKPKAAESKEEAKPAERHNVNLGMGMYVPTSASASAFGLEANAWCLHAMWLPARGAGGALDATTGFDAGKVHFRVHWIALGVFFNTAQPVVVPEVDRSWDILAYHGVEFRTWKGLTVKGTVNWFFPNPYGIYKSERDKVNAQVDAAKSSQDPSGLANADSDVGNRVKGYYQKALAPTVGLSLVWEF